MIRRLAAAALEDACNLIAVIVVDSIWAYSWATERRRCYFPNITAGSGER